METESASGWLRPGSRIYAVGDIHGHGDLLNRIAAMVATDLATAPAGECLTVFLGDYIDRGPDSAAVIERLRQRAFPTPIVLLRGNHEQMLLDGLLDDDDLENWVANGGDTTAASYGLSRATSSYNGPDQLRDALLDAIPAAHLDFLHGTELSRTVDGYFFCHAGIEPGIPLDEQDPAVLMWIRRPFHQSKADHGKVVVHGHTPVPAPESLPNRINIDTGAFRTGRLTCLVLEGAERRFLST